MEELNVTISVTQGHTACYNANPVTKSLTPSLCHQHATVKIIVADGTSDEFTKLRLAGRCPLQASIFKFSENF